MQSLYNFCYYYIPTLLSETTKVVSATALSQSSCQFHKVLSNSAKFLLNEYKTLKKCQKHLYFKLNKKHKTHILMSK